MNRVIEPISNANVKHSMLNANSELICATCNECMFDAIHDLCVLNFVNDVNVCSKSKSAKSSKKKKTWKPARKILTNVGCRWLPTGRTFTIDGKKCLVTRITSTRVVPPKETSKTPITTPNPEIKVVQIVLWYLDSGCSKHMTGNRSKLINFVHKFLGIVRFGNDQIAKIMGYCDFEMGNVTISRVYYVEGLGHNLFSVGKFCDSDLKVAFCKHTCYIRDLEVVDLLEGSRGLNLYTLSLEDMGKARNTPTNPKLRIHSRKSLSAAYGPLRANEDSKYQWAKIHIVRLNATVRNIRTDNGTEFVNQTLRAYYEDVGISHQTSVARTPQQNDVVKRRNRTSFNLCGPMRIQSINGRKYILVIVNHYSRFTWVKFLQSKDEVPEFVIKFLKMIQVRLNATVRNIRTDNGTKFVNQTLRAYYEDVRISHQTSVARSPQQNDAVERRNLTLVEAARTMLIFPKAPLFLWAEVVATTFYTQNRSLIRKRHNKTPYEVLHDKKPYLSYLYVFGALCYPTNDSEDLGKLKPKVDIGIFVGYALAKKAYRIYNKRTRLIIETIHIDFDELTTMASE
ncbi:retrovirus-related pol polyprotein from transposon TNT 1-94 [Tanacetum coccineum]